MTVPLKTFVANTAKRFDKKFWKRFIINLRLILKEDYYPHLVEQIVENYKMLPGGPSDDPTALMYWEDVFREHLMSRDVRDRSISVTDKEINIDLGDKAFLGYGSEGDDESPDPIIWMVYFISDTAAQGIIGKFAFISKADYEKSRGPGSYRPEWGRFGQGFMLSELEYMKGGWEKALGNFSSNEHPLSKMLAVTGPINIFEEAFKQVEASSKNAFSYVADAIKKTLKEMESGLGI